MDLFPYFQSPLPGRYMLVLKRIQVGACQIRPSFCHFVLLGLGRPLNSITDLFWFLGGIAGECLGFGGAPVLTWRQFVGGMLRQRTKARYALTFRKMSLIKNPRWISLIKPSRSLSLIKHPRWINTERHLSCSITGAELNFAFSFPSMRASPRGSSDSQLCGAYWVLFYSFLSHVALRWLRSQNLAWAKVMRLYSASMVEILFAMRL